MLASLLSEIRRRHLWPIPVLALLVAVGAPLLFLKPAPPDAPHASTAAPAPAATGALPTRAERLLATSDGAMTRTRRSGKAGDPFRAPSSHRATSSAASSTKTPAATHNPPPAGTAAAQPAGMAPVPVVVTNADGTKPATTTQSSVGAAPKSAAASASPRRRAVDVRFGKRMPAPLHRRIPRLRTFVAGGRVIAIFVKYSPARHKAVFAIAPRTLVTGDIECRRKEGLCRYVDIPVGKGVRLTTLATDRSLITRRLDVLRIHGASQTASVAAARRAPADGACLLGRVLKLTAGDMPLPADACQS